MRVATRGYDMRMPADVRKLAEARRWATEIADQLGFSEDDRYAITLAVSEGVTNAIIHGSASQSDCILLKASEEGGGLAVEVRDRGTKGADYPVARISEGGRGLELVALMMDEVQLTKTEAGSVLRFVKCP